MASKRFRSGDVDDSTTFSISDLASEFDISSRTIRFYEEKGLLCPQRTKGNQRRYSRKDRFRLKWILRGKRFGYSLDEIAKMLGMTETDMDVADQIRTTLAYGQKKLVEIEDQINELKILQQDMLALKQKMRKRLADLENDAHSEK